MTFDWTQFLLSRSIEYVTRSPNIARGEIGIRCPFCGEDDPSEHMSISLTGKGFVCRRNSTHSGRAPNKLVMALIGCSSAEARRIVGDPTPITPLDEDLPAWLRNLMDEDEAPPSNRVLEFPKEFKPLAKFSPFGVQFSGYLIGRGFTMDEVVWLADSYNLHYATRGPWAYRLIIPIYDRDGKLMSWIGRTILPDVQPRYKALSVNPEEGPAALGFPAQTLLGVDLFWKMKGARTMVVLEGSLDAMKVNARGYSRGIWATCLFGLKLTEAQAELIEYLAQWVDKIWMVLDKDAEMQGLRILEELPGLNCLQAFLPKGVKDPCAMGDAEMTGLLDHLLGASA